MQRLSLLILLLFTGSCYSASITANCLYLFVGGEYTCFLISGPAENENDITAIEGRHYEGLDDNNVTSVWVSMLTEFPVTPVILCEKYQNIDTLMLSHVKMEKITEKSFSKCRKLRKLELSMNKIKEITENAFSNNFELESINLNSNPIARIDDFSFRRLMKLTNLEMMSMQLERITPGTFRGLRNLINLRLDGGLIDELNPDVFADLHKIEMLSLATNRINRIHPKFLSSLPQRDFWLNLTGNMCISMEFNFRPEIIRYIWPFFIECFHNYKD